MKTKKNTIIFSGLLTLISIGCFSFLHFRVYHLINIYGNDGHFLKELRDFMIVSSSGLFTGSCVTLIVSIREYLDVKETTLKHLLRYLDQINERYQKVQFFISKIPEKIVIPYLIAKHYYEESFNTDIMRFFKERNMEFESPCLKSVRERNEKLRKYIWENELSYYKELYISERSKDEYLDKKCSEVEKEYLEGVKNFTASLHAFDDISVFQIQEAFAELCFFNKKKQNDIVAMSALIINDIIIIKKCLNLNTHEISFSNSLNALRLSNSVLIEYSQLRDTAYLSAAFRIDTGKLLINKVLNPHTKKQKELNKQDYDVHYFYNIDYGREAIWENLGV